jgi:hypothetical protein
MDASGSNEINQRRSFLQLYAGKISVTREVTLLQVSLNAQPYSAAGSGRSRGAAAIFADLHESGGGEFL